MKPALRKVATVTRVTADGKRTPAPRTTSPPNAQRLLFL